MTPPRRRNRRLTCRAPICIALALLTVAAGVRGQEPDSLDGGISVRQVFVPARHPEQWPRGDWQPVNRTEFRRKLGALSRQPATVQIERSHYTATLSGDALRDGTFHWEIRNRGSIPSFLGFEASSFNLHLESLKWVADDGAAPLPAIFGTEAHGRFGVIVDRREGRVSGSWSLPGRRVSPTLEFELRLPPADISTLDLTLPSDRTLESSVGDVLPARPAKAAGFHHWIVELGGNRTVRLTIRTRAAVNSARPLALTETAMTVAVRRDLARIQSEIQVKSLESSLSELLLELDPGLELLGVTYGDAGAVEWSRPETAGPVRVKLPESAMGTLPPVTVSCLARLTAEQNWTIPEIRVANAVETDYRIALRLPSPEEFADIRLNGYRQIDITTHPTDGETRLFRRLQPGGRVTIVRAAESDEYVCESLSLVRLVSERLHCETELRWTGRQGQVFTANCRIPEGWEVVNIRLPSDLEQETPFDWDLATSGAAAGLLTVHFREPLETSLTRRLIVISKRTVPFLQQELLLPVFAATEPVDTEAWVVVESSAQNRATFIDTSGLDTFEFNKIPREWDVERKWRDERYSSENPPVVLRVRDRAAAARVSFQKQEVPRTEESPQPATPIETIRATAPLKVERLDLEAALSYADGGFDRYVATYQLRGWKPEQTFRWRLNESAMVTNVLVDNMTVATQRNGADYVLAAPSAAMIAGAREDAIVEIQYRVPAESRHAVTRRELILPTVNDPKAEFQLTVALPERIQLRQQAEGVSFREFNESRQRRLALLGPLAGMIENLAGDERQVPEREQRRWTTSADGIPERIVLVLGESHQSGALCWTLTLATAILGCAFRQRVGAFAWLLLAGLALAGTLSVALAPLMWVEFPGSVVAGVVVATLIPRSLIAGGNAELPSQIVPQGSTQSFAQFGVMLLACSVLTRQDATSAQEAPPAAAGVSAPAAPGRPVTETVLVPLDEYGRPSGRDPVVYISAKLAEHLARVTLPEQLDRVPDYLLSGAAYDVEISDEQTVAVRARLEVVVLADRAEVDVRIPLSPVSLAGDEACRVNGQVRPTLNLPSGGGLLLSVPGAAAPVEPAAEASSPPLDTNRFAPVGTKHITHSVELSFYVPVEETDRSRTAGWGVPRLPASRLSLTASPRAAGPRVTIFTPTWERSVELSDRDPSATLACGASGSIGLQWPRHMNTATASPPVEATASLLADLDPRFIVLRYHVEYRIPSGSLSSLEWSVPAHATLESIQAPHLLGYALGPAADRVRHLTIEFSRPQKNSLTVTAAFIVPRQTDSDVIQVPVEPINQFDPNAERVRLASQQLALRSGSDYEFDGDAEGQSALLRPRTVDEFLATAHLPGPRPQQAFVIARAGGLPMTLRPRVQELSVAAAVTIHLQPDSAQAVWSAEIEPHPLPLFQYRLHLEPEWGVEKVSVQEDGVERVLRWSRSAASLAIFLHDHSTARQTITIEATRRLALPGEFDVPQLQIENATSKSRLWMLIEDTGIDAKGVDASGSPYPAETPPEERDPGALPKQRIVVPDSVNSLRIRAAPKLKTRDAQ